MPYSQNQMKKSNQLIWLSLGTAMGTAFGAVFGNKAMGTIIGMSIGVVIAAAFILSQKILEK